MKKTHFSFLVVLATLLFSGIAASAVVSERGDVDLMADAPEPTKKDQVIKEGGFERSYKEQPPMIPHRIDKEEITMQLNTCLKCHSEKTYQEKKAPKAGDTHYFDRDGKKLATVSSRRWFCTQCHAPQVNAQPLVDNVFQGRKK